MIWIVRVCCIFEKRFFGDNRDEESEVCWLIKKISLEGFEKKGKESILLETFEGN